METTVESNEHRADARLDRLVEPAICVLALVLLNMIVIYVGLLTMMWQSLKLLSCRKPEQRRERVSGIGISAMLTLAGVATLPVSMILGGGVEFGGNAVGNLVSLTTFWTGTTVQLGKLAGAVLLVDARKKVSQVDKKLSLELQRQHKPTIIAVNKWDLVDESDVTPDEFLDYLTKELRGLDYAPIVFISALEADGMRDLVALAFNLHQQASYRETTGRLNDVMEQILQQRGPSSKLGTQAKLYYITQVETSPPTIVMVVNDPKLFEGNYERYILNRLRDELPYSEVPIRLVFKKRGRKSLHQLKFGTDEQQGIADAANAGEFLIDTADHEA